MGWFDSFLSPDSVSGRLALVALGSVAAVGAGIYYMTSSSRNASREVNVQVERREEDQEVEIQVSTPPRVQTTTHVQQQIFVSEVEAERFALLLIVLVICMTMVLSTVDHVAPTDYRLFVPLLMTGTGLYGASKIPKSHHNKKKNEPFKNKETKTPDAIPTSAPSL